MRNIRIILISQFLIYIAFLGLVACTEAPPDKSGVTAYGEPVNYLRQKEIKFPGFSLYYLGNEKADDASQIAYDADRSYQFEITHEAEKIRVTWNDADNSKHYERFDIGDAFYFLQIKSSYFQNKGLNPGELVIWDFVQFQKHLP